MKTIIALALTLGALGSTGAIAADLHSITTPAERTAFEEQRYGITTADPYRWMEDPARKADMIAFLRAASDESVAQLAKLPRREAFAKRLESAMRAGVVFGQVKAAGQTLFYQKTEPQDRVAKLMVREGGKERILFDPGAGGANAALGAWNVSPDGKTIAAHVSEAGAEVGEIRFLDAATGRETRPRIGPAWGEFSVAWLTPDRIGFTLMDLSSRDPLQNMRVHVASAAGDDQPVPVFGPGIAVSPSVDPAVLPILNSGRGDWAIAITGNAGVYARLFVSKRQDVAAGRPVWRAIAAPSDKVKSYSLSGDDAWLVSAGTISDGQLLRVNAATGVRQTVVTPAGYILEEVISTGDGVYVVAQKVGESRLLFFRNGSGSAQELALPFEASLVDMSADVDGRGVVFTLIGWTTPARNYRAEDGRISVLGLDSVGWAEARDFIVRREEAISTQGARVPMVVITPKGSGPWQTILDGYGSYGILRANPYYYPNRLSWVGESGALAYCGTRGGGERGRAWHEAGRERNKPNAHADLIACAERLVSLGIAKPGGIGVTGGSAGGLLVPVAVQKRPDLFGAVLPRVAVLNASRLEVAVNGPNQFQEMGDPSTAEGYAALVAQDAYLTLAEAKDIPDTLATIGLTDMRVNPWMTAKFVARARDRFGASRAILVRADGAAGHGVGSARDRVIEEWVDVFAFLADRLEVKRASSR